MLRDNKFSPDTMIRRALEGEAAGGGLGAEAAAAPVPAARLARWSAHRVMQWLKEIDLAEYAPNLRGAGRTLHKLQLTCDRYGMAGAHNILNTSVCADMESLCFPLFS